MGLMSRVTLHEKERMCLSAPNDPTAFATKLTVVRTVCGVKYHKKKLTTNEQQLQHQIISTTTNMDMD